MGSSPRRRDGGVPHYGLAGIGAGPANLSVAALADELMPNEIVLFDRQDGPSWHPGLLGTGNQLQTSWIKDLVSLADPRNRLSFLNYLVTSGRIYAFLNAQFDAIPRLEYARYLAWAAEQLGSVHYGVEITGIRFDEHADRFVLSSGDQIVATADHLSLGLGTRPRVPQCFQGIESGGLLLAEHLEEHFSSVASAPYEQVIVVGGGQTGAECVLSLINRGFRDIRWMGRRQWFAPMDDSPTANDLYRPTYVRFFQGLPSDTRERYVDAQTLTSDGISMATLQSLYQANYEAYLRGGRSPVMMLPGRDVQQVAADNGTITLWCKRDWGGRERHAARYVVLATGREPSLLPLSPDLVELMETDTDDEPVVEADYSIRWKYTPQHRIFVQNRARVSHGLADPNLSLLAVRSAVIVNSLLDRTVYNIRDEQVTTVWS